MATREIPGSSAAAAKIPPTAAAQNYLRPLSVVTTLLYI